MTRGSATTTAVAAVLGVLGVLALAGCVPSVPMPVPSETSVASPSAAPTPTPTGPAMVEGGTAKQNQAYFDSINLAFFASNGTGSSVGIVDNLVAAGFRKQDMQVTIDRTSIDLEVDSRIVSVRLKGECLLGSFQASGYKSMVAPLLATGGCLIGTTVPLG